MQESLLSQRLLFYGSSQLERTCRSTRKTDGGFKSGYPLAWVPRHYSFLSTLGVGSIILAPKMWKKLWSRNSLVRYTWMTTVEDFTKRNLSHPGDKLIAISAIATLVQASLRDDYLAGMWRQHDLAGQLLWRLEKPETGPRPQGFIAPSWSWASFGGEISYMNWRLLSKSDVTMELLRWEVIPVSPNAPYGAISSAYLHTRSLVMDIKWDNKWQQMFRVRQEYQKEKWI